MKKTRNRVEYPRLLIAGESELGHGALRFGKVVLIVDTVNDVALRG